MQFFLLIEERKLLLVVRTLPCTVRVSEYVQYRNVEQIIRLNVFTSLSNMLKSQYFMMISRVELEIYP